MKDFRDMEDKERSIFVYGGLALLVLVVGTIFYFYIGRDKSNETPNDFSLSKTEQAEITAKAKKVIEITGSYGVTSEANEDNFLTVRGVALEKYFVQTSDPDIKTRQGIFEETRGYMTANSRIESNYAKLTSWDIADFLRTIQAEKIELDVPDNGYVDAEGFKTVSVVASFSSVKTLAKAFEADIAWNGDVKEYSKVDDEEVKLIFKKDSSGIWALYSYTGLKDPSSLALSPADFTGSVDLRDYEETEIYNVGVVVEPDIHDSENTTPNPPKNEDSHNHEPLDSIE